LRCVALLSLGVLLASLGQRVNELCQDGHFTTVEMTSSVPDWKFVT